MIDYQTMYNKLFNAVTDVISILQKAQLESEEEYLNQKETKLIPLSQPDDDTYSR